MKARCLFVLLVLVLAPVLATAQSTYMEQMRIDVPFAFSIADQRMPAGTYLVGEKEGHQIVLRSIDGKAMYHFIGVPQDRTSWSPLYAEIPSRMVFRRYGNSYFLGELAMGGAQTWQLPQTTQEAEYSKAGLPFQRVTIAGK
jgi:hypothetical protein